MSISASSLCQMRYDELEIGTVIGKGCSSVVLQATHRPTGTPLALKVSLDLTSIGNLDTTAHPEKYMPHHSHCYLGWGALAGHQHLRQKQAAPDDS